MEGFAHRKIILRPMVGDISAPPSFAQDVVADAPRSLISRHEERSVPSLQAHSPFFSKLPYDIRRLIYLDLISGSSLQVHLAQESRRVCAIRCRMPDAAGRHSCLGSAIIQGNFLGWLSPSTDCQIRRTSEEGKRRLGLGVLSMASVCSRIHGEMMSMLYTYPTFILHDTCTLSLWKNVLVPRRLDMVRSLRLELFLFPTMADPEIFNLSKSTASSNHASRLADEMWQKTWNIVADMQGLRKLRVVLNTLTAFCTEFRQAADMEIEMLQPLCRIRRVEDYEVMIGWKPENLGEPFNMRALEIPFRLVRSN